jgi:hypothetical protein
VIKKELDVWKDSMTYSELEIFLGCVLADLRAEELLTDREEAYLRASLLL